MYLWPTAPQELVHEKLQHAKAQLPVKELPARTPDLKLWKEAESSGSQPVLIASHCCDIIIMPRASAREHKSKEAAGEEIKALVLQGAHSNKILLDSNSYSHDAFLLVLRSHLLQGSSNLTESIGKGDRKNLKRTSNSNS